MLDLKIVIPSCLPGSSSVIYFCLEGRVCFSPAHDQPSAYKVGIAAGYKRKHKATHRNSQQGYSRERQPWALWKPQTSSGLLARGQLAFCLRTGRHGGKSRPVLPAWVLDPFQCESGASSGNASPTAVLGSRELTEEWIATNEGRGLDTAAKGVNWGSTK